MIQCKAGQYTIQGSLKVDKYIAVMSLWKKEFNISQQYGANAGAGIERTMFRLLFKVHLKW